MTAAGNRSIGGAVSRSIGVLLLVQFAAVCIIKIHLGIAHEILWMSHVGLLLAGLGLALQSSVLIGTSFICVLVLHGLWLTDCVVWLIRGRHPLGITNYLDDAATLVWLATLHHFYLAPLLLLVVRRLKTWPKEAMLAAIALYLALTVISRGWLPPAANVNYAFGVLTSLDNAFLDWANRQPGWLYMLGLNAFVVVFMFWPAQVLGRTLASRRNAAAPTTRHGLDGRVTTISTRWSAS